MNDVNSYCLYFLIHSLNVCSLIVSIVYIIFVYPYNENIYPQFKNYQTFTLKAVANLSDIMFDFYFRRMR